MSQFYSPLKYSKEKVLWELPTYFCGCEKRKKEIDRQTKRKGE